MSLANLPSHNHSIDHEHGTSYTSISGDHTHNIPVAGSGSGTARAVGTGATSVGNAATASGGAHHHTISIPTLYGGSGYSGSGTAFNKVQASKVCYKYKRTG